MLSNIKKKQILLVILDGWGYNSKYHGNAIKQAKTPTLDFLWHHYPTTLLNASENHVGLPSDQVGNSEVGHTTIGAGRTIDQALVRISKSISDGSFFKEKNLNNIYRISEKKASKIHLIGLCSDGGVHSHFDHLIALLKISNKYKNVTTHLHLITDGRDTKPQSAKKFLSKLLNFIDENSNIVITTVSGRYYSMDRDCRWKRTEKAYNCLVENSIENIQKNNILNFIDKNYEADVYDEFILPTRINRGAIENDDGIIFFNFRPDRMRQLVQAFCLEDFRGFKTQPLKNLNIVTFTMYDSQLNLPVIFKTVPMHNFLGQVISESGLKQFRLAETEKYAHVTYFFNGGREEPFPGEDRALIPSPQVETYDTSPNMSACNINKKLIELSKSGQYNLIIVNYANPDMLGHTGNFLATKAAIEHIDQCLHEVIQHINNYEIVTLLTADHGNADVMLDKHNKPCKSHTKNLVPFIIINDDEHIKNIKLAKSGSLADIAPTILNLLQIDKPNEMDGISLITSKFKIFSPQTLNSTSTSFN